jgi:hypothetical protein
MRTTIAIATFLAVGAGAAGVGALNLKGSDTLKDLTVTMLTEAAPDCGGTGQPPGTLVYDGTGSGNGQAAMQAGTQLVAPMSKPLGGVCGANQATAEGIVFELDGVSVVADGPTWGSCNGASRADCTPDPAQLNGGLSFNKVITPNAAATCTTDTDCNDPVRPGVFGEFCDAGVCKYNLSSWKQALRILYYGVSSTDASGNVNKLDHRNCGSPERQYLAANWNAVMQTCSSGSCPAGIQHAFRRNDESGTTDVFTSLLGVPGISQMNSTSPFCNVGTQGPTFYAASPPDKVCNVDTDCLASGAPAGMCATDATSPTGKRCSIVPKAAQSAASTFDANLPTAPAGRINQSLTTITICQNSGTNGQYNGEYFTDLQDHDVIRRVCKSTTASPPDQGQEDVCSARGDLGLVLPIWDVPSSIVPTADAFPTAACTNGKFTCVSASRTSCPGQPTTYELCPDGSDPNAPAGTNLCPVGQCAYPAIAVAGQPLNPKCVASKTAKPPGTATFDGRVFNLTTWTGTAATGYVKAKIPRATGFVPTVGNKLGPTVSVAMVGAFYRIHSIHTMDPTGALAACQRESATDQIGCLVHASPCSIGYAGNSAANGTTSVALKVNNVDPNNLCVQNFLTLGSSDPHTYPVSRKLYLNSLTGFENVSGDQLKLAKCFSDGTAGGIANSLGFIPLPPTDAAKTAAKPFCEDFNEQSACGAASNNNACAGNDAITGGGTIPANTIPSCQYGQDPVANSCHFGP